MCWQGGVGRPCSNVIWIRALGAPLIARLDEQGAGSSKQYFEDWRRESHDCDTDLEDAVTQEVARLEALFPPLELERVIRASGVLPHEDR